MKTVFRYTAALLLMLCAASASAQTTTDTKKIYVCEGFDDEDYNLQNYSDLQFSEDGKQLIVGEDIYDIAEVDSITFSKPVFPCVNIVWKESTASVTVDPSITGVSYKINGGHVTITSTTTTNEILYVLSGSSANGSFYLDGKYKLRMHLNGVSLTNPDSAAVNIHCGKRIEVKLMKNTENVFVDSKGGTQDAAFLIKGHLEIKGKGTLTVTGNTKHALQSKEYLKLKTSTGTINILGAVKDGIHCGEGDKADPEQCQFTMNGGTVNIKNCGSDCIDADDYGSMFINGGTITMDVSQTDGNGLACDSIIYMTGGTVEANVTGAVCNGIRFYYDAYLTGGKIIANVSGDGSKGIKANRTTATTATVRSGGNVHFQGTDVEMTLSGGTYTTDKSECMGIRAERTLYQTDGNISIKAENSAAIPISVRTDSWTGGTRDIQ